MLFLELIYHFPDSFLRHNIFISRKNKLIILLALTVVVLSLTKAHGDPIAHGEAEKIGIIDLRAVSPQSTV